MIIYYFVGYTEIYKYYNIYIPTKWKIVISIYVKFDEDVWSYRSYVSPLVI